MHWLAVHTGLTDASGPWYLWWSGFAGDLGLFAAITVFYWKHTCHQGGCYRIGKHVVDGIPYCSAHHKKARK